MSNHGITDMHVVSQKNGKCSSFGKNYFRVITMIYYRFKDKGSLNAIDEKLIRIMNHFEVWLYLSLGWRVCDDTLGDGGPGITLER